MLDDLAIPLDSLLGQALAWIRLKRAELLAELSDIDRQVLDIVDRRERLGREVRWLDEQYAELIEQYSDERRRHAERRAKVS